MIADFREVDGHFAGSEFDGGGVDWHALLDHAELNTRFYPGDLLAGPVIERREARAGEVVELTVDGIGTLRSEIAA